MKDVPDNEALTVCTSAVCRGAKTCSSFCGAAEEALHKPDAAWAEISPHPPQYLRLCSAVLWSIPGQSPFFGLVILTFISSGASEILFQVCRNLQDFQRLPPDLWQLMEETRNTCNDSWKMHPEMISRRIWIWLAFARKLIENICLVMGYYGKDCVRGLEHLHSTWGKRILLKCYQYLYLQNAFHPRGSVSDRLIQPL